jgi:hypothetical protein
VDVKPQGVQLTAQLVLELSGQADIRLRMAGHHLQLFQTLLKLRFTGCQ